MRILTVFVALFAWLGCESTAGDPLAVGDANVSAVDGGADGGMLAADGEAGADTDAVGPDTVSEPDIPARVLPEPAPPKAYSGGVCPTFAAGANTIMSDGRQRDFLLYPASNPEGGPLLFVWHPLGGSAAYMANAFSVQSFAASYNATIVVPDSCGNSGLGDCTAQGEWNYVGNAQADLTLFDDLVACLDAQYDIDNRRVSTTGFSAGSLWSTYLLIQRADYLAAAAIFSGGTGLLTGYATPAYKTPTLLVHGGSSDVFGGFVFFDQRTEDLYANLRSDGHYVVICRHTGGHTVPAGGTTFGMEWLFSHAYGDGSSPYEESGPTGVFPDYCTFPHGNM